MPVCTLHNGTLHKWTRTYSTVHIVLWAAQCTMHNAEWTMQELAHIDENILQS
jgi:hypothetical protein